MKKEYKFFIISATFIVYLFSFFGQFLIVNNETLSAFQIIFNEGFSGFSILFICPFILILLAFALMAFDNKSKVFSPIIAICFTIAGVFVYFAKKNYSFGHGVDEDFVHLANLTFLLGIICFAIALFYISKVFETNTFSIRDIVEIAMLVGLALVLDLSIFKIRIGSNGGSISLSMVPLFVLALRKGPIKGFIACGIVFGLVNSLLDNYGFVYYPLDYLLPFGSIALAGLFSKFIFNKENRVTISSVSFLVLAIFIACLFRTFFHTLSGVLLWHTDLKGSLIYQLSYMGPDTVIVIIVMLLLYKPLIIINKKYPSQKESL